MLRKTRLLFLIGALSLPAVAWAGHAAVEAAGLCPFCDCERCPLAKK
jgi:hypothetical protein